MIHSIIANYFDNPTCTKIRNDASGVSIYYTRIRSTTLEKRYLICTTPLNYDKAGSLIPLRSLPWISCMTTILPRHFPLQEHAYRPKRGNPFDARLLKVGSDTERTVYASDALRGVNVSILSPRAASVGTLNAALETYNTALVIE